MIQTMQSAKESKRHSKVPRTSVILDTNFNTASFVAVSNTFKSIRKTPMEHITTSSTMRKRRNVIIKIPTVADTCFSGELYHDIIRKAHSSTNPFSWLRNVIVRSHLLVLNECVSLCVAFDHALQSTFCRFSHVSRCLSAYCCVCCFSLLLFFW